MKMPSSFEFAKEVIKNNPELFTDNSSTLFVISCSMELYRRLADNWINKKSVHSDEHLAQLAKICKVKLTDTHELAGQVFDVNSTINNALNNLANP